jgi:hypothetical protein
MSATQEPPLVGRTARSVALVGLGSGVLAGLLGIGGGAFTVFGLVAFAAFSQHRAHATSLATIPPVALAAALVFGSAGNVDLGIAALLVAGSLVGALLGARVMAGMSELLLRRAFGLLMLAVGLRLLL